MSRMIISLVALGLLCFNSGCSDKLPPVPDGPKREGGLDMPVDGPSKDSTVDGPAGDSTLDGVKDTPSPDTTSDGPSADTTSDGPSGDTTKDTLSPDTTKDTLSPDTTKDTLSPDTTKDSSVDQPPGPCAGKNTSVDLDNNGAADCAENLLINGQFTNNTNGWQPQAPSATLDWGTQDAQGSGTSGSARVGNVINVNVATVNGATQCVRVNGARTLTLYAQWYIPPGQPGSPSAGFQALGYASIGCTGTTAGVFNSPLYSSPVGAWSTKSYQFTTASNTASVRIRLNVRKQAVTPAVYIRYDNVLLK